MQITAGTSQMQWLTCLVARGEGRGLERGGLNRVLEDHKTLNRLNVCFPFKKSVFLELAFYFDLLSIPKFEIWGS